jgi:thymidylate synthase (FAD)
MKIIKPSYEIINEPNWDSAVLQLEKAMRTCYKSEAKITKGSAEKLIKNIIKQGHESTLEHISMSVKFICDRGISHELVRHRHCSFSQESTRYVKYDGDMEFILPCWMDKFFLGEWGLAKLSKYIPLGKDYHWTAAMLNSEKSYQSMLSAGFAPQQARSVLSNSLKTEIVMTTNLRDWRHIFHLRSDKTAHPQMRELMIPLYNELVVKCPIIFDSVEFS